LFQVALWKSLWNQNLCICIIFHNRMGKVWRMGRINLPTLKWMA
jgi:hypothetical protein